MCLGLPSHRARASLQRAGRPGPQGTGISGSSFTADIRWRNGCPGQNGPTFPPASIQASGSSGACSASGQGSQYRPARIHTGLAGSTSPKARRQSEVGGGRPRPVLISIVCMLVSGDSSSSPGSRFSAPAISPGPRTPAPQRSSTRSVCRPAQKTLACNGQTGVIRARRSSAGSDRAAVACVDPVFECGRGTLGGCAYSRRDRGPRSVSDPRIGAIVHGTCRQWAGARLTVRVESPSSLGRECFHSPAHLVRPVGTPPFYAALIL